MKKKHEYKKLTFHATLPYDYLRFQISADVTFKYVRLSDSVKKLELRLDGLDCIVAKEQKYATMNFKKSNRYLLNYYRYWLI